MAERYDGSEDAIFELQDRITEQVAGVILPSVQKAEICRVNRKPPCDLGVFRGLITYLALQSGLRRPNRGRISG